MAFYGLRANRANRRFAMTSIDFVHSGPHDALILSGAAESGRSRLGVIARRIAGAIALAAVVIAVMALRYWLYLPALHHPAG
jgi:hypothetical protein